MFTGVRRVFFMTFSYHLFLQELTGLKITSAVVSVLLSAQVLAVQPMSESDLEVVSATTGSNILNIFGASQESFDEGEATKPIALNALRAIEDDNFHTPNNKDLAISKASQFTILKINEQTTGSTSLFTTSSEINYKTSNVHHEMREIRNGGVAVSRDLYPHQHLQINKHTITSARQSLSATQFDAQ